MKKFISILIALIMVFVTFPAPIQVNAETVTGVCGDNLTWSYDTSTATLTISGTGHMTNYGETYNSSAETFTTTAPWSNYYNSMKNVVISYGVTSIGDWAFSCCSSLTSVTIGNSVTTIGDYAFSSCTSLTSVTIPDSVTSIGYEAFSGCSSLASVTIGNSVTSIGDFAFSGCSSLTSVAIGNSVTSIGDEVFYGCSSLDYNTYDNAKYLGNNANPYVALIEATSTSITSCTINSNTKVIYGSAFSDCSSLTLITIPDGVTSIGYCAFLNCSSLTSITIPDSVTSIGGSAFYGCSSLNYDTYDNAKYLGNSANPYFALIKATNTSITSCTINNNTKVIVDFAFLNYSSLTSITIPYSVTSIGGYAFYGCSSLTSVTIGNSVTFIGEAAFYNCTSLASITIPDSVTSIGYDAFYGCSKLTFVTIGNSVTSIGALAFYGCSSLSDVYYIGTEEEWNKISIGYDSDPLLSATIHFVDPTLEYSSSNVSLESAFDAAIYGAELIVEKDATGGNVSVISSEYDSEGAVVYDIYLEKDGKEVQPSGEVTVKIPVPEGMKGEECKVFRITDDEAVDMNAEYADGYLAFKTDHFSYYAVVQRKPSIALKGDINKDDDVTMKDVLLLRRYIAGLSELDEDGQRRADINADDDVTMKDVLKLRRMIAGIE